MPTQERGHVMTEDIVAIAKRMVVGRKRDGRSVYDPQARIDLVRASQRPRASRVCVASTPMC